MSPFRITLFLGIPLIVAGGAYLSLRDTYRRYAETQAPVIEIVEVPSGIGAGQARFRLRLSDDGAGLDEVVVRLKHKSASREVLRKTLGGGAEEEVEVKFSGQDLGLVEGSVSIEIRAFDRSFWSNAAEQELKLKVDYRKPRLEVVSSQHNARRGGAQMIFYRAFDQDLALSGVQIGEQRFFGVPASQIDKEFQDPELFAAIFALGLEQEKELPLRLFAEDKVGNVTFASFYYTIGRRGQRRVKVKVEEDYLRYVAGVAERAQAKDAPTAGVAEGDDGLGALIRQFKYVSHDLRAADETTVRQRLYRNSQFTKFFDTPFQGQPGVVRTIFGDYLIYAFEDQELDSAPELGVELIPNMQGVIAQHDGLVAFTDDLPFFGKCVAIDHGLGLSTFYARLGGVKVSQGSEVKKGQEIAVVGGSGFGRKPHLYLQFRVNGMPVDPREWWDLNWYNGHITGKVKEVKRSLGTFNLPEE